MNRFLAVVVLAVAFLVTSGASAQEKKRSAEPAAKKVERAPEASAVPAIGWARDAHGQWQITPTR